MKYVTCALAYVMVLVAIIRKGDIAGAVANALNQTGALLAAKTEKVNAKIDILTDAQMQAATEAALKIKAAGEMRIAAQQRAELAEKAQREAAIAAMNKKHDKHAAQIGKLMGVAGTLAALANPALGSVITAIGSGIEQADQ